MTVVRYACGAQADRDDLVRVDSDTNPAHGMTGTTLDVVLVAGRPAVIVRMTRSDGSDVDWRAFDASELHRIEDGTARRVNGDA